MPATNRGKARRYARTGPLGAGAGGAATVSGSVHPGQPAPGAAKAATPGTDKELRGSENNMPRTKGGAHIRSRALFVPRTAL